MAKEDEHIMYTMFENHQAKVRPTIEEIRLLVNDTLQLKPMMLTLEELLVKNRKIKPGANSQEQVPASVVLDMLDSPEYMKAVNKVSQD
jgi:hypothetical protein